jgi:hypothetical protein
LLAEVVDLLLQLLVVVLRAEETAEPAGPVAKGPGDALGADLEWTQDARAGALEAVQDASVGFAEIDRDHGKAHDREHGDHRPSPGDALAAGAGCVDEPERGSMYRSPPRALTFAGHGTA